MLNSKYSNLLTILLIVVIVGIVGLLCFLGFDIYRKFYIDKETSKGIEQFDNIIGDIDENDINDINNEIIENTNTTNEIEDNTIENPYGNTTTNTSNNSSSNSSSSNEIYYKGFVMKGKISIPRTGLECPILENATKPAIEVAVGIQCGPGLNQIGNTVIAGHNYRNGLFFSNNKKIQIGDKISIKDTSGLTVKYTVYSIFETTPEDSSYLIRNTNGAREITLYTCTDDGSRRLIILAKE